MTRTIVFILLTATSCNALAAWVRVFDDENAGSTIYIDPLSIRKDGDRLSLRVMSVLRSPDTVEGKPYVSVQSQKEYDCKQEKVRTLDAYLYSGEMGSGELVARLNPDPHGWKPLPAQSARKYLPQGVLSSLWALLCGT